jgi:hypothetical protein
MTVMSDASLAAGQAALGAGRWVEARAAFEAVLAERESAAGGGDAGTLHGWVRVARAYRMEDLDAAAELTGEATWPAAPASWPAPRRTRAPR